MRLRRRMGTGIPPLSALPRLTGFVALVGNILSNKGSSTAFEAAQYKFCKSQNETRLYHNGDEN